MENNERMKNDIVNHNNVPKAYTIKKTIIKLA